MGALLNVLAEDRNAEARVLLDIRGPNLVVLLDGRVVATSEDANEALLAFRCIRRAVSMNGEQL